VRVQAQVEAIANAAQTLGRRTMQPDALKELLEGKFVDALRTVAAEMTMEELHEKRGEYIRRVRDVVAEDLLKNGLELESASLTQLDQTSREYFNPSNAFDAEGLTRLTEQIERRKKQRNDVEQDTMIAIRNKNLEAEKLALDIERDSENARLAQERELEFARAQQRSELARERAERERDAEQAQVSARERVESSKISSQQVIDQARIKSQREVENLEIERRKVTEIAEQQKAIAVAAQSKAHSEAQADADRARAQAVTEEERVFTAREVEMANRKKQIELIGAQQEAEREGIKVTMAAQAEKTAAVDHAAALTMKVQAEADAEKIKSAAYKLRNEVQAEGTRLMNEAHNILSNDARASRARMAIIENMEGIIRESVKPMERIEGIKILHVDGLGGGGSGGGGGNGSGEGGNFADQVVNSALRYRAQAPLVDQMLREIGVDASDVNKLTSAMAAPNKPVAKAGE
jgi:uncharacterized membrane protein YqiK